MEDISALCRRVMVLGHGSKLFDGALEDLYARYRNAVPVQELTVKYPNIDHVIAAMYQELGL